MCWKSHSLGFLGSARRRKLNMESKSQTPREYRFCGPARSQGGQVNTESTSWQVHEKRSWEHEYFYSRFHELILIIYEIKFTQSWKESRTTWINLFSSSWIEIHDFWNNFLVVTTVKRGSVVNKTDRGEFPLIQNGRGAPGHHGELFQVRNLLENKHSTTESVSCTHTYGEKVLACGGTWNIEQVKASITTARSLDTILAKKEQVGGRRSMFYEDPGNTSVSSPGRKCSRFGLAWLPPLAPYPQKHHKIYSPGAYFRNEIFNSCSSSLLAFCSRFFFICAGITVSGGRDSDRANCLWILDYWLLAWRSFIKAASCYSFFLLSTSAQTLRLGSGLFIYYLFYDRRYSIRGVCSTGAAKVRVEGRILRAKQRIPTPTTVRLGCRNRVEMRSFRAIIRGFWWACSISRRRFMA